MTRNSPRHLALVLAAATPLLAPATPLQAQGPGPHDPTATALPGTDIDDRRARIDTLLFKQHLAGAALAGIGVPGGIMLARSRNAWNPVDEGWIGLCIAEASAATGLFLLPRAALLAHRRDRGAHPCRPGRNCTPPAVRPRRRSGAVNRVVAATPEARPQRITVQPSRCPNQSTDPKTPPRPRR